MSKQPSDTLDASHVTSPQAPFLPTVQNEFSEPKPTSVLSCTSSQGIHLELEEDICKLRSRFPKCSSQM